MNARVPMRNPLRWACWAAFAALWLIAAIAACTEHRLIVDEVTHVPQISVFLHGHLDTVLPSLTNIPGYHLLVAGLLELTGFHSLAAMRMINMGFGLLGVVFFFRVCRKLKPDSTWLATAQFAFFPLLFPYGFLVYTDVLSVALLLAAFWATLCKRHILAGLIAVAAMAVRQNDVVWVGFLALFALWPVLQETGWKPWLKMRRVLGIAWPYLLAVFLFIAYWAWNGSIVFSSDQQSIHPDMSFHWGNLYFFLFAAGLFLPLLLWGDLCRFVRDARSRPWWLLLPLAVFVIYAAGFSVSNFFNLVGGDYFLHNAVLIAVHTHPWAWWGFGLLATVAACALARTRFVVPQAWVLFPLAAFYLAASWLIQGRYTMIPFALWLVLRQHESPHGTYHAGGLGRPFAVRHAGHIQRLLHAVRPGLRNID